MKFKILVIFCVLVMALSGLSFGDAEAKNTSALGGGGHYEIDLGGGGQYIFDLGGGGQYFLPDISDVQPIAIPEGKVSKHTVWLEGNEENNHIYLAEDQYINLILPDGGGGQYQIIYTRYGGGGQYSAHIVPKGGGGQYVTHVKALGGGGQYSVLIVPLGGGGQY